MADYEGVWIRFALNICDWYIIGGCTLYSGLIPYIIKSPQIVPLHYCVIMGWRRMHAAFKVTTIVLTI